MLRTKKNALSLAGARNNSFYVYLRANKDLFDELGKTLDFSRTVFRLGENRFVSGINRNRM